MFSALATWFSPSLKRVLTLRFTCVTRYRTRRVLGDSSLEREPDVRMHETTKRSGSCALATPAIVTLFTLFAVNRAFGFACIQTSSGQCIHWAQHAATVETFLGAPTLPPLANGTLTWDQNVLSAATEWNSSGANFQFTVAVGGQLFDPCSSTPGTHVCVNTGPIGNNPVIFRSTFCGMGFGDILELVNDCWDQSGGIINAPVFVNSTVSWNAYDGPLQFPNGQPAYDIRRVLLHDFGHVLGLDHPDAHGQTVNAIMNSRVSDLDRLQPDDSSGILSLYGSSLPPSGCAGDCNGDGEVTVDEIITMVNIDLGSAPPSECTAGDANHDQVITIDELVGAVNAALSGCSQLPDLHGRAVSVAVETSSPPFDYIDLSGQGFGWDYDTVGEICRRLNCVAQFEPTSFQGVFNAVNGGQFDVLADGVTITAQRQQLVSFSTPYVTVDEVLLVPAGEIETLAQFKLDPTNIVGAQSGTTNEQTAINSFGAARVTTAPTDPQIVSAVLTGTIAGAVLDSVAANTFARGNPGQLKTLGTLISGDQLAFAFPPHSTLVGAFNAALQSMMNDGTLTALNIRWGVVP